MRAQEIGETCLSNELRVDLVMFGYAILFRVLCALVPFSHPQDTARVLLYCVDVTKRTTAVS